MLRVSYIFIFVTMLSVRICPLVVLLLIPCASFAQKKDSVWIKTATGCKIHNPYPQPNESITWTGSCVNSFASGEGTLTWYKNGKSSSHYEGSMKRGSPAGKGRYFHSDGSVEEGTYERGELNGHGAVSFTEEGRKRFYYEGEFKYGLRTGDGYEVYFTPNGDTAYFYTGSFIRNGRTGKGRMIDYHGRSRSLIIEGNCNKGKFYGDVRIWFLRNGKQVDYYEGGYGGYTSVGVPRKGYGVEIDGHSKYIGDWANGFKEGRGKLYYDSTLVYDGEWTAGDFSGTGTRHYFDGSKYVGEFKKGKRHGVGKLMFPDGMTYTGEFKEDLFDGHGYFTTRDNKPSDSGMWEKGRLFRTKKINETIKALESRFPDKLKALNSIAATAQR